MSEIARELKMLFYLNEKYKQNQVVSIKELSELLEISSRQVRRYRDDLDQAGFTIESKKGNTGGYYLEKPLNDTLVIPNNLVLAINIALKSNTNLFQELNQLPVISSRIIPQIRGDNEITNEVIEKEILIVRAIQNKKKISFIYNQNESKSFRLLVEPYRLVFFNRGYYLKANYLGKESCVRTYSIEKMDDIREEDGFQLNQSILEKIENELFYYGIIYKHKPIILELKYKDTIDEYVISKYFENKATFYDNKICKIETINIEECFYPICSLGNKVKIIDENIKERYIDFLKRKIDEV